MKSINNRYVAGLLSVLASVAMMSQVYAAKPVITSADDAWANYDLLVDALFKSISSTDEAIPMQDGLDYLKETDNQKWFNTELPEKIKSSANEQELVKFVGCSKAVECAILDWADMALNGAVTGTSLEDVKKATGDSTDFIIDLNDNEMKKAKAYHNAQDKLKEMYAGLRLVSEKIADKVKERCCTKESAVRSYLKMTCMIEKAAEESFNQKLMSMAKGVWDNMVSMASYLTAKLTGYINKQLGTGVQATSFKNINTSTAI